MPGVTEQRRRILGWPEEWGGADAPLGKQFVYQEELAYANAPAGTPASNITGAIMLHASDEMKQRFLPRMAKNEVDWAQGFSEPNAGTDLASLQTRAVEDGDDFVVTGQKIWSSGSHFADWYHVLVRTDPSAPKHRGITYLMMQLKDEDKKQTRSGIHLPDKMEIPTLTGRVVTVAFEVANDDNYPIIQYDRVLFNPKEAIPVDFEGDNRLFVVPVENIVAVFRAAK